MGKSMLQINQNDLKTTLKVLKNGGILAVPTETVYGLAVKFDYPEAISKLKKLKNRPEESAKIFTLMISDRNQIKNYGILTQFESEIAEKYFPGELTLVLNKNPSFKNPYFDHFESIGIRIPAHDFMLNLLQKSGPLIVTSANYAGEAPALKSQDLNNMLEIDGIIKGESNGNPPSTVIKVENGEIKILRQGGLKI
jgi:L-threonylcarbamoyladenylate synthase